jgi:Uma2 family endonuclease
MARHIEDEVKYYYDSHPTEEDLMGETAFHANLVHYLMEVLRWLVQAQVCAVYENLNMYQTRDIYEYPVAPDIAVIKGVAYEEFTRSWRVGKSGPAPQVVFEIASEETWKKDLTQKPEKYARMGVQEYFAYDPHEVPLSTSKNRRLFGWQLNQQTMTMQAMTPASNGALWSPSLDSWLVPDGTMLRLYDRAGQLRLTRAEAEARRAEAMAEKLRSLGIDPNQLI